MKSVRKKKIKKLPARARATKEKPMRDSELENLSVAELRDLLAKVEIAIADRQAELRTSMRERFRVMAEEAGLSLTDIVGGRGAKGKQKAAQFANPENRSETWTGRGRMPNWLRAKLKAGATIESFRV